MIHSKDKRAIIIKDPQLVKIRNSLRDVIFQAAMRKKKRFYNEWRAILLNPDGTERYLEKLSSEELDKFRNLQKQENQLTDVINRSILKCVSCGKGHRNMVYNKPYDAWYYTFCYGLHLASVREYFEIKPYLLLPKDHPFFSEEGRNIYNTLMTETDMFIEIWIKILSFYLLKILSLSINKLNF
ncbi:MAG: hypothetical protein ACFFD7_09145 [Candidatus Thorarchaeota archaeon]